jgi:hypothetical protein
MYTNKSIKLVSKALAILEMLQKVNNRIEDNRRSLRIFDAADAGDFMTFIYNRSFFEQQLEKNLDIQNRVFMYYFTTLAKATHEAAKQSAKVLLAA